MTNAKVLSNNSESFTNYLNACKDKVKSGSTEGYYHVDVVAEAYTQGFEDGKKMGKSEFVDSIVNQNIEKFLHKANQIYILSKKIVSFISKNNYKASGLFISLNPNRPSVIISVPDSDLNNDEFVHIIYPELFEAKDVYLQIIEENFDIGLVANDNLDVKLLEEDGYGYQEIY